MVAGTYPLSLYCHSAGSDHMTVVVVLEGGDGGAGSNSSCSTHKTDKQETDR